MSEMEVYNDKNILELSWHHHYSLHRCCTGDVHNGNIPDTGKQRNRYVEHHNVIRGAGNIIPNLHPNQSVHVRKCQDKQKT